MNWIFNAGVYNHEIVARIYFSSMIAVANNMRRTRGPVTSPCHASAGTCSVININLGVIYEYRPEGNALSTKHEKAIVLEHDRRPRKRKREIERDISAYAVGHGLPSSCFDDSWRAFVPPVSRTTANYFSALACTSPRTKSP